MLWGGDSTSIVQRIATLVYASFAAADFGAGALALVYLYGILSILVNTWLAAPIAPATYEAERREGDFRFAHIRVREYSESVAFYGGEDKEATSAERLFDAAFDAKMRLIWVGLPVLLPRQMLWVPVSRSLTITLTLTPLFFPSFPLRSADKIVLPLQPALLYFAHVLSAGSIAQHVLCNLSLNLHRAVSHTQIHYDYPLHFRITRNCGCELCFYVHCVFVYACMGV